jgi:chromosome segregation ATPase
VFLERNLLLADIARRLGAMESVRETVAALSAQMTAMGDRQEGMHDTIAQRLANVERETGQHRAVTDSLLTETRDLKDETRGLKEKVGVQNGRVSRLEEKEAHRTDLEQMRAWFGAGEEATRRKWVDRWQRCLDWAGNGTVRTLALAVAVTLLGALGLLGVADTLREWLP